MSQVRFKVNVDGFREIRYSKQTQEMLEKLAEDIADVCNEALSSGSDDENPGYKVFSRPGRQVRQGRWRVSVTAVSPHAIRHNGVHNTLLRALGGAK